MKLLPQKLLIKRTTKDDCANFYYKPIIGYLYRKRLEMIDALIKDATFDNILDIGYGSGIFFPELKKHSSNLFGIDIHEYQYRDTKKII